MIPFTTFCLLTSPFGLKYYSEPRPCYRTNFQQLFVVFRSLLDVKFYSESPPYSESPQNLANCDKLEPI